MTAPILPKERRKRFAYLYAKGLIAGQAVRQAGFSDATVTTNAYRIPKGKKMAALIATCQKAFGTLDRYHENNARR